MTAEEQAQRRHSGRGIAINGARARRGTTIRKHGSIALVVPIPVRLSRVYQGVEGRSATPYALTSKPRVGHSFFSSLFVGARSAANNRDKDLLLCTFFAREGLTEMRAATPCALLPRERLRVGSGASGRWAYAGSADRHGADAPLPGVYAGGHCQGHDDGAGMRTGLRPPSRGTPRPRTGPSRYATSA